MANEMLVENTVYFHGRRHSFNNRRWWVFKNVYTLHDVTNEINITRQRLRVRYRHVWASENPLSCCQSWRGRGGVDEHASEVRLPGGLNCFGKHRNGNCKVTARTATQQNSFCYLEMDSMHSSGRWVAKRETISGVGGWPWKKNPPASIGMKIASTSRFQTYPLITSLAP